MPDNFIVIWRVFERGGPVMWPLLLCSLVSLTVTVERLIFWWRESLRHNETEIDRIFRCAERRDYENVLLDSSPPPGAVIRMLLSGLVHRDYGLRESMETAAMDELDHMKRGLRILDTIVTLAPLLGILGTVTGIIHSFDFLGRAGIEDPREVVDGIAQALITTAFGLGIALLTLVLFNYLVARVEKAARTLEQVAARFEVAYKRGCNAAAGR
ncbi:MAG: MotA/TolQ/ExbB proton channel family protein [Lentisphaerales bacterium]|jgi:biopolymer transport protein ExbB|nr:MAG: MotA/TolQ/ExbB proton channel family protein [Lentisphaerales bacterium]